MCAFPAIFSLSSLNGINGFQVLLSSYSGGCSGLSYLAGYGNFNKDSYDDAIIYDAMGGEPGTGRACIVYGTKENLGRSFNLHNINGENGFCIVNTDPGILSGCNVFNPAGIGDINGDGIDDIAVLGYSQQYDYQTYIIFGSKNNHPSSFDIHTDINEHSGFIINNPLPYGGEIGSNLFGHMGDINHDGINDIGIQNNGKAYLVFGARNFSSPVNLSNLNGNNGFSIVSPILHISSIIGGGDINGDHIDDIILGTDQAGVIMFGNNEGFLPSENLNNINGTNGFIVNWKNYGQHGTEVKVNQAGDINADGLNDIIAGYWNYGNADDAYEDGRAYMVYGTKKIYHNPIEIDSLNGTNGFTIENNIEFETLGTSVSGIGDVNKDGIDDFIVGAPGAGAQNQYCGTDPQYSYCGLSYLIYGATQFPSIFGVNSMDSQAGTVIEGIAQNEQEQGAGANVAAIGDFNGDGIADFSVGASYSSYSEVYIGFGEAHDSPHSNSGSHSSSGNHGSSHTGGSTSSHDSNANSQSSSQEHHYEPSPNTNTGAIIGGAVGGVIAAGLIAGLILYGKSHGWWCSGSDTSLLGNQEDEYGAT